jgi:hypothetical protein
LVKDVLVSSSVELVSEGEANCFENERHLGKVATDETLFPYPDDIIQIVYLPQTPEHLREVYDERTKVPWPIRIPIIIISWRSNTLLVSLTS